MSTQTQSHKFAAVILQNLPEVPEDTMQGWIENLRALKQLLAGLNPPVSGSCNGFKVWRRITLGTSIKDADGFRYSHKQSNMRIGDWANDILGKPAFSVATDKVDVDLVVVSVAELGFPKGATLKDIYVTAKKCGLELCPNEVGPQLRLQYRDQPKDEWFVIGMEPITCSEGGLRLFHVEHGGRGLWLSAYCGSPDTVWNGYCRFVFVLSRK